jgi:HlyD family secretion protein
MRLVQPTTASPNTDKQSLDGQSSREPNYEESVSKQGIEQGSTKSKPRRWLRVLLWCMLSITLAALLILPFAWQKLSFAVRVYMMERSITNPKDFIYTTYRVDRGTVEQTISARGVLRAARSTAVGAEVSGQIAEVYVTFNERVQRGKLLAIIDPKPFMLRVQQAQARVEAAGSDLKRAQANITLARADLQVRETEMLRQNQLAASGFASTRALENARLELVRAQANIEIAEAAKANAQSDISRTQADLAQARFDLARTQIKAPSDGVVVRRLVEPGQTVASTLQTPQLFELADSLSTLQLEAQVDEADIADVALNQLVRFSVDAYPNRIFQGRIALVRNDAIDRNGIVSYPVRITVDNRDQALKPGMSATLTIVTRRAEDALRIPVAALEFVAPANGKSDLIYVGTVAGRNMEEVQRNAMAKAQQIKAARSAQRAAAKAKFGFTVWRMDNVKDATMAEVPIKIGARNDDFAEIVSGDVKIADEIVTSAKKK